MAKVNRMTVSLEDREKKIIDAAAELESLDPAVYVRSAAMRFTRDKYPELFADPAAKE